MDIKQFPTLNGVSLVPNETLKKLLSVYEDYEKIVYAQKVDKLCNDCDNGKLNMIDEEDFFK